ncbi:MAG TPA: hypothetical protein VFA90_16370 [Terriglobales bacterium]|nr:hypothetical protein [Terriglobales bacterium]
MATINRTPENEKKSFQQIESDNWSNLYLPAICAGVVMTIVLFMAVSCSKQSDKSTAKITPPTAPSVEAPAPAATPATAPQAAKKIVKKHRPANATYVNGNYGVSFSYPRKYSLHSADKQKEMPVDAGFVKPGAVEIASVDMPDTRYPDTDFSSALLNVSVNTGMGADECSQFGGAEKDQSAKIDSVADAKSTESEPTNIAETSAKSTSAAAKPTAVKLGRNEFSEVEHMKAAGERQSDLKYFHVFKNGACYEFALDVETFRKGDEDLAQVDRGQVFRQLEKILASARIKDVELPGVEKAETATSTSESKTQQTTDAKSATTGQATPQGTTSAQQTEKAEVVTPQQK